VDRDFFSSSFEPLKGGSPWTTRRGKRCLVRLVEGNLLHENDGHCSLAGHETGKTSARGGGEGSGWENLLCFRYKKRGRGPNCRREKKERWTKPEAELAENSNDSINPAIADEVECSPGGGVRGNSAWRGKWHFLGARTLVRSKKKRNGKAC